MRGSRAILAVLAVVIFSAVAIGLARRAADVTSSSDTAVIETYTLLASQGRLLVGAYSRFQWHHPGPLYFYLLAPFYLAADGKTAGLNAGAAVMALVSMVIVATILLRRRPRLAVVAAAGLALFAWRASEATASPWNPHVAVLPVAALVVVAADIVAGSFGLLPVAAALASLAGQAHVGLMPCVLVVATVAAIRVVVAAVRNEERKRALRSLAATAVVLAVCWALPVYEQVSASPHGNIILLWQFFVEQVHHGQPLAVALSAWADMLVGIVRPDFYPAHGWPFVESPVRWAEALSLSAMAVIAFSAYSALRHGDRFAGALACLLLAASAIGLWSATRIDDRIFDHDLFWLSAVGLLVLAVATDTVVELVWRRGLPPGVAMAAVVALLATAAAGSISYLRTVVHASFEPPAEARIAAQLAADIQSYMARDHIRRPLIKIDQDAWPVAAGAILALQKRGDMTAVEEDWVVMFTPAFRVNGTEDAVVTVAAAAEHLRLRDAGIPEISSHEPVYAHAVRVSGR